MSARLKLTLSYTGFLMLAGALLLAAVWLFLLRYVPDQALMISTETDTALHGVFPVRSNLLRAFAPKAAAVLAVLLVFGLAGGWLLAGRMLAPLTRISEAARAAGDGSLSHRIRMTGRRDEFGALADTFDAMLDRLESHVTEQRRFAANASHELRTPLAVTRAVLDVARRDPGHDRAEVLERLHAANTRAIDLTEALLLLSRAGSTGSIDSAGSAGSAGFAHEPVDLSLLAEEAAETLLPLAEQRGITLDVTGGPAPVSGSPELLLRVVTNLLQNAIVHNVPTGGTATVHTHADAAGCVLQVANTGPAVPPALLPTLIEPFQRGAERIRSDGHAGVGLGLAIVHSITRAHHGALTLNPLPTGGLLATVHLPAGPATTREAEIDGR